MTLLGDQFSELVRAVAEGSYVFWIGSGISRDRVPALGQLVDRILVFLQSNIDHSNAECAYRRAFESALDLADLSALEAVHTDMGKDVREWATHDAIVFRLSRKYSELLDIEFPGKPRDFLLWIWPHS